MWTAILVLSLLLIMTGLIAMGTGKEDDNIAAVIIGVVVDALAIVLLSIYCVFTANGIESVLPLTGHIDSKETVIKEENGDPTDLYITVDGKEYHIILQEMEEE